MSYANIQETADEVRLLLLKQAAEMAKSHNPLSVLIAAETVRRVSAAQPPTPPVIGEDIVGMVGTLHPMTNHVVDVDVGERGEVKTIALKSKLAPQITLHRGADGAFRTDPNWVPPGPTAVLVPLKDGEAISPGLTLFGGADGAWREAPAPAADPLALHQKRLDHFREALEFIAATRYGVAARQALTEDAAFVADPTQPLTFTPPPPRKGTEDAPASVPPPVVIEPPMSPDPVPAPPEPMAPALAPAVPPPPPAAEPPSSPPPVQPRWPTGCHTAWGIAPENIAKSGLPVLAGDAVEFTDLGSIYLSHHVKIAWTGLLLSEGINVAPVSVDSNASRFLTEGQRVRFRQSGAIGRLVNLPSLSPSV